MLDEARQDPVEVEPAADVAGHAAQRVGPMELVADVLRLAGGDDDRRDADGHVAEERRVERGRIDARAGVDDEHAPRPVVAGDRHGRLGPAADDRPDVARRHRPRPGVVSGGLVGDAQLAGPPAEAGIRRVERVADHAEVARQLDEPRRAPAGAGDGMEPLAAELEHRDCPVRAMVADRGGRLGQRDGNGRSRGGDPGQLDEQASIGVLAAGVDRSDSGAAGGGAATRSDSRVARSPRPTGGSSSSRGRPWPRRDVPGSVAPSGRPLSAAARNRWRSPSR